MDTDLRIMAEDQHTLSMNPKKFALWLFIGTVVMLFGALTSAFIVMTSERSIIDLQLPSEFLWSTITIVLSSITIHWAYYSAKKDELEKIKLLLSITFVLGLAFLFIQFRAWIDLVAHNAYFVSNEVSSSFIYVLTGLHGLHLISALLFLLVVIVRSFKLKIHAKKLSQIEMCVTYWHFLGGLWVYLYIFLMLNFN